MEYNNSINVVQAMSYLDSTGSMSAIAILIGVVIVTLVFLSNDRTMKLLLKFVNFMKKTFGYFFYGVGGSIVLGLFGLFVWINTKQISRGKPYILMGIGLTILVYTVMTSFGYLVKLLCDNIKESYKKAKNNR